jgi:hypothetical protein
MADLEHRDGELEAAIGETRAVLARLEDRQIAMSAQISALRGDLGGSVEFLCRQVEMLPTTWDLLVPSSAVRLRWPG